MHAGQVQVMLCEIWLIMIEPAAAGSSSSGSGPSDVACEEHVRQLLGLAPDLAYRLDDTGVMVWLAPAMATALHCDPRDLAGITFEELFP